MKNAFPFLDKKYRTIDHPRYHELREVGEFNLDDWNWDRKCERDRVHRAEVEEMRWRIEEARSFFDPEAQEGAVWVIALGGAMAAIGLVGGSYLTFPTM